MSDPSPAVGPAGRVLLDVARTVTPDQHGLPTPCDDWDVRGVLNAVAVKAGLFVTAAGGQSAMVPQPWPDLVGDDPYGVVLDRVERVVATFSTARDDRLVLPIGDVSWTDAQRIVVLDLTLHAWDLAHATDQPFDAPDVVLAECLRAATDLVGGDRADDGGFKPAIAVDDEALPLARILALSGRRP